MQFLFVSKKNPVEAREVDCRLGSPPRKRRFFPPNSSLVTPSSDVFRPSFGRWRNQAASGRWQQLLPPTRLLSAKRKTESNIQAPHWSWAISRLLFFFFQDFFIHCPTHERVKDVRLRPGVSDKLTSQRIKFDEFLSLAQIAPMGAVFTALGLVPAKVRFLLIDDRSTNRTIRRPLMSSLEVRELQLF